MKISLNMQSKIIFFAVLFTTMFAGLTFGQTYPQWQNDKTYDTGDIIEHDASLYIAIRYVYLNTPPTNAWFWEEYPNLISDSEPIAATLFAKYPVDRVFLTGYTEKALKYSDILEENTRSFDSHNAYDPETGLYTVPKSGYYHLDFKNYLGDTEFPQDQATWIVELMINNSSKLLEIGSWQNGDRLGNSAYINISINQKLNKGDTIYFRARWRSGCNMWVNSGTYADYFSIHMIK